MTPTDPSHDPVDPQTLRALADRALELHETGDADGCLRTCAEVEETARRADRSHPVVRESLFTVRFQRGVVHAERGELDTAVAAYLAAASLPVDEHDPDQTHELAMALLNAGICWSAADDPAAAVATYDDLLDRLGDATDPVTSEQVVKARVNRAVALLELGRPQDAVAGADALLADLGDTDDAVRAEQRGMALRLRAQALRDLGRLEDGAATLAAADALAAVDDPATRTQAVAAQGERAELLAALGRAEEAIAVLEDTAARFADDSELGEVVGDLRRAEAELLDATGQPDRAAQVRSRL